MIKLFTTRCGRSCVERQEILTSDRKTIPNPSKEILTKMFRDKRPQKRLRLAGPPPHTRSIHVRVRLEWSHNKERLSGKALLLLDSGTTGAVLSSDWVKNAQVPCIRLKEPTPTLDASGNQIPGSGLHYTTIVDMYIGDHRNNMRFEVADMPAGKVNGYLPMSLLKDHTPDINWEKGSLNW